MNLIVAVAIVLLNLYVQLVLVTRFILLFCQYTFRMFQLPFVWKLYYKQRSRGLPHGHGTYSMLRQPPAPSLRVVT